MFTGTDLLDYTNLFSPNEQKDKIIQTYLKTNIRKRKKKKAQFLDYAQHKLNTTDLSVSHDEFFSVN